MFDHWRLRMIKYWALCHTTYRVGQISNICLWEMRWLSFVERVMRATCVTRVTFATFSRTKDCDFLLGVLRILQNVMWVYDKNSSLGAVGDTCDAESSNLFLKNYLYMLLLGQALNGYGGTCLYSLGVTYLDQSVSTLMAPLYIGKSPCTVTLSSSWVLIMKLYLY